MHQLLSPGNICKKYGIKGIRLKTLTNVSCVSIVHGKHEVDFLLKRERKITIIPIGFRVLPSEKYDVSKGPYSQFLRGLFSK